MAVERERAKLFDREAERYDRTRPAYPDALINDVLGPAPERIAVLDVACGSGIASRQMIARGAEVLGVDLNEGMARIARLHGVTTEIGEFESWDPAGRTFDRVTCAQAWHWLEPEVCAPKAISVLRPGGRLCLFWSVGEHPEHLAQPLADAYARALPPDAQPFARGYGTNTTADAIAGLSAVADLLRKYDELDEPRVATYPWEKAYSRDEWLDELLSHSDHAALSPDLQERVLDAVGRTIDEHGGRFVMTYVSILVSAYRS